MLDLSAKKWAVLNCLSFVLTLVFNYVSAARVFSDKSIGEVGDQWENAISPSGGAFGIWGVIYLLLCGFCAWNLAVFCDTPATRPTEILLKKISWWFVWSNIFNSAWILIWVQGTVVTAWLASATLFSLVFVLAMLCLAIRPWLRFLEGDEDQGSGWVLWGTGLLFDLPFSIYFGWCTVASIINFTTALVAAGYKGENVSEEKGAAIWGVIVLCVASLVFLAVIFREKNFAYGLVFTWAAMFVDCDEKKVAYCSKSGCDMVETSAKVLGTIVALASIGALAYLGWQANQPENKESRQKAGYKEGPMV